MGGIADALDACLCNDDEMANYRATWSDEEERLERLSGSEEYPFRFEVGTRVKCAMGDDVDGMPIWERGVIVAHHYREPAWPPETWMPYQVHLDSGDLIFAPADVDACIQEEAWFR